LYEKPKVTRFMHVKRENNSGKPWDEDDK
jgi:hypothetical protein